MSLRFIALVYRATLNFAKKPLVILLLVLTSTTYAQSPSSNEDLKKQANKLFEEDDYSKAYKLYSQLVSNFPKDPVYNFRLGVCMIYAEPDKKKCLPYLKFAAANADNKELKDAVFYLGKGYHINYRFDDAIKNYNAYKLTASASQIKKLEVDREIKACSNGKHLLSNLTDLEVISKAELSENDYFRNYKKVGGKLLVKPEEFKTAVDKKKKEKSVIFLPNGSDVVYYSSYGENPETGRDIYTASKQANGAFGKPEKVAGINTEFDEDYPFLHPDGKTLYFASKGHNSMGGYDIFKSVYNEDTRTWSSPENLEFPINSPDDDFLFVTDSLETIAYFSTGRQSPPGKIDVLKVKTKRRPIDIVALKGSIIPGSPEYGLKSTINVKDVFSQNELGTYNSDDDGSYTMELPNGGKFLFTVETPGLETQSAQVNIPLASAAKNFKQTISYEKGKLKILNYFDEALNDNSYLQYLNVIEKKAKLDVTGESSTPPLAVNTNNPEVKPETSPQTNPSSETSAPATTLPDPKTGMDNKQLANLARQDADESKQEAGQLHRDFLAANETGLKQKEEADKKAVEASDALFKAETISDPAEKKIAIDNANALKLSAENDQAMAAKILKLAQSLDDDAKHKETEAKLNTQYANELDKAIKKDPKASPEKLAELQKQLSELSDKKNESENLVKEIKADIEQKEKQIADLEQSTNSVKANLQEVKTALADKETELDKTKKKSAKKELTAQVDELRAEQDEKLKQISNNEAELKILNEDLVTSKNQLEVATKITTEHVTAPAATVAAVPVVAEKISIASLQDKYKAKTSVTDPDSRSSVEASTVELNNFNRELDQLISKNKADLPKTKNADAKAKLNAEIKKAETSKKLNQSQIASNNTRLIELNKAPKAEPPKNTFDPITATNSNEAVSKLDNLTTQLAVNDNENFDYNGYQNVAAQNLKIEADAKINDAIAKQKQLKDDINASKQDLQKSGPTVSAQQLSKEGDDYLSQAQKLNNDAKTSTEADKEKLLTDAKNLEEKANIKYIEAADVTRSDNTAIVAANQENIQNLINDGKSSGAEVEKAKALNEEAKAAFRKAADIRVEGNSLTNTGAKLGSYSNAEEKEAEAILKQQQALDILTKSNPDLKLKTPITSSSTPSENTGAPVDINSKLQTVNKGLTDLATVKIESYQKLYEANNVEIEQLVSDINANQSSANNTPSLRTDFISANNKVEASKTLKQTSDNSANPNEKLNSLIASNKKQTEAIKQFNAIRTSLNLSSAPSTSVTPVAQVETVTPVATTTTAANPDDFFFGETTTTPSVPATPTDGVVKDELGLLSEVDTRKVEVSDLATKDTTATQILSYFDNTNVTLRNPQASSKVKASLSQLKDFEAQESAIDDALSKVGNSSESNPGASVNIAELNTRADVLWDESETASAKSFELKKEAQGKEGAEKDALLEQAKELENQSQDKLIEAADYKKQANEGEYKLNTSSIAELLAKLKSDDPAKASELEAKNEELSPLRTQINNLRSEANALSNKAAKLGAISNAEEKELELIQKQNVLLSELKKKYPDYVAGKSNMSPEEKTADLQQKKSQLHEKQYSELTNLTNGLSLEYESSKNTIPANLTADQQAVKANADELNAESKRLLIQSSQTKDEGEKIKLLTLAAKSGNAAVEKLNKVLPKFTPVAARGDFDDLETIGENIAKSNSNKPAKINRYTPAEKKQGPGSIKIDGLEVVSGNAYSAANPIPMDARMESGLVFRVQIGAFKTPLPNNAFKGLSPLNGETAGNGYIRYTAGNFEKVENANAVKNDLRNLGYRDAFVVVYFNGRRISLAEALAELEKQGKTVDPNAPQTAGITSNVNVPKAATNPVMLESVTVSKELEQTDGLLYTIQIGVYTKEVAKSQILSLRPIFREQLKNGLYRYTAGIYNNPERLLADKNKVVSMGIRDAFVSAYLNGKRVPFAEARDRQASNDATLKVQAENPIIFPSATTMNSAPSSPDPLERLLVSPVKPFKNEVTNYPAPTAENGVKTNEEGVTYKVQIGAFSKQVPDDVAAKFSAIRNWPVDNKQINGLFIYNIGNFGDANNAKRLKDEAVRLGITDAFVTVYRDGKKLYGPEAENYLR